MIGAHKTLKPILINEYNDPFEILVIEIQAANKEIRLISGYGQQETWTPKERLPFFEALEEEIIKAELAGKSVIIEADFNSKLGKEFIPTDPHDISPNGKILAGIIQRQKLTVLNGSVKCKGTITRARVTTHLTQRSAISFVLVSEDLVEKVESVVIDEEKVLAPTRITPTKTGVEKKTSDHNVILTKLKLPWNKHKKEETNDLFNLKNKECQIMFKEATSNNNNLSKVFLENTDLETATNKFMKKLKKVLHKCFQKIKLKKVKPITEYEKLYNVWKEVKSKTDPQSKQTNAEIETELADSYFRKIEEAASKVECDEGGITNKSLWELKKKICPNTRDPPTAMLDSEGNLVTSEERIKELAVKT